MPQKFPGASQDIDVDKNYRHAFLIIKARRQTDSSDPRHVLCAESDADRDSWADVLVRWADDDYYDVPQTPPPSPSSTYSNDLSPIVARVRITVPDNIASGTSSNKKRNIIYIAGVRA